MVCNETVSFIMCSQIIEVAVSDSASPVRPVIKDNDLAESDT